MKIVIGCVIIISVTSLFWFCFKKFIYKNKIKDDFYCEVDLITSIIFFIFGSICFTSMIMGSL